MVNELQKYDTWFHMEWYIDTLAQARMKNNNIAN